MSDPRELIDGYFDDTLTVEQHEALSLWIKAYPENARIFAQASLFHDRLRNALCINESEMEFTFPREGEEKAPEFTSTSFLTLSSQAERFLLWRSAAAAAVLIAGLATLWFSIGTQTASAAIRELDRIIVYSMRLKDRTYEIIVEDITRDRRSKGPELQRPPKPPLDGATLHVRSGNQFVLFRKTKQGLPFVTGSNGQQSWAINTRGPVRVSSDIHRFDHDLPGHETSVPLTNLHDGLQQLKSAYDLTFSTLGPEEYSPENGHEARLLVAVKKPRERGPQRVEIVYDSMTGGIMRMRFVQMPYGPDRLDIRLSMVSEEELPIDYFDHTSHHSPDHKIEMEN